MGGEPCPKAPRVELGGTGLTATGCYRDLGLPVAVIDGFTAAGGFVLGLWLPRSCGETRDALIGPGGQSAGGLGGVERGEVNPASPPSWRSSPR